MGAGKTATFLPMDNDPENASLRAIATSRSLSDLVADYLIQQLISGRLAQGQRVNEAELARALGISRNPIREAISGLHERGMLIAVPRRGSFVRRFTTDDVNEIFSFRMILERFTVQAAAGAMWGGDMEVLTGLFDATMRLADEGDVHAVRKHDMLMHAEIARVSGNRHAMNAFENLSTEVLMLMTIPHEQVESLQASVADHLPIIDALRTGSQAAAMLAMEQHLRVAWALLSRVYAGRSTDDHVENAA